MSKKEYSAAEGGKRLLEKPHYSPQLYNFFLALHAKLRFETDVFFMILQSKIMKNTSVSK